MTLANQASLGACTAARPVHTGPIEGGSVRGQGGRGLPHHRTRVSRGGCGSDSCRRCRGRRRRQSSAVTPSATWSRRTCASLRRGVLRRRQSKLGGRGRKRKELVEIRFRRDRSRAERARESAIVLIRVVRDFDCFYLSRTRFQSYVIFGQAKAWLNVRKITHWQETLLSQG